MASQGWTPGTLLGASDAPHAEFHTAANASYIRVVLKDDNLGIGAKRGSGLSEGECTGLDVFQSLLGRLNGNEEEVERERKSREDLKRAIYTERKWGSIRFVKGGLLIGDKIQKLIEDEAERVRELEDNKKDQSSDESSSDEDEEEETVEKATKEKKAKKASKDKKKATIAAADSAADSLSSDRKSKSEKKKRKAENSLEDETMPSSAVSEKSQKKRKHSSDSEPDQNTVDKAARKAARRERKAAEAAAALTSITESSKPKESKEERRERKRKEKGVSSIDLPSPKIVTPLSSTPTSGAGTPNSLLGGRHAVRSRNIMQKRMAVMDTAALNQIFMIKS